VEAITDRCRERNAARPGEPLVALTVEHHRDASRARNGLETHGERPCLVDQEAAEQKRWMTLLSLPFVAEAVSVGLVFGTGKPWYLGISVASIFATVLLLTRLILSSETNSEFENPEPGGRRDAVVADARVVGRLR
jgi:hypothetical protein